MADSWCAPLSHVRDRLGRDRRVCVGALPALLRAAAADDRARRIVCDLGRASCAASRDGALILTFRRTDEDERDDIRRCSKEKARYAEDRDEPHEDERDREQRRTDGRRTVARAE